MHCPRTTLSFTAARRALLVGIFAFVTHTLLVVSVANDARADDAPANDALAGYANYRELQRKIGELTKHDLVTARPLGKTIEGRDVTLITIGIGDVDSKPAIAVVGNVDAGHLVGTELAMRVARQLAQQSDNESVRALLQQFTVYVIPRPSPDASEKCFASPRRRPAGNARKTDDDRDHKLGEDPPEDLNGDGLITMMRVADATGPQRRHPNDPRVMIAADRTQGEKGEFRLYVEGIDNDQDGKWNEDAGDGVAFNRNFPFNYPFFKANAGPHQVSEAETRAVADFLFNRTNIAMVLTFTPEDNVMHLWKTGKDPSRIPIYIDGGDLVYVKQLAEKYRKIHGGTNAPANPPGAGSFSEWAYFHYGRWSLATRGWWVPKVDREAGTIDQGEIEALLQGTDKLAQEELGSRGQADINALRWMEDNKIDGFVDWQAIDHPGFPGKKVEIGGFKPLVRDNPPASELDELGTKYFEYVKEMLATMPRISVHETTVEPLGSGVFRVKATVINTGFLPTSSEMGRRTRLVHKVQIALDLPERTELLRGPQRVQLQPLKGSGGTGEHSWLLRVKDGEPRTTTIRAWAPSVGKGPVGNSKVEIELK